MLLDFDLLATYRLDIYERDCRKQQAQMTALEVSKMFTTTKGTFD